jgi:hypothetical protein
MNRPLVLSFLFVFTYAVCPCAYFPMGLPCISAHTSVRLCFSFYTAPFDTLYLLVIAFAFLKNYSSILSSTVFNISVARQRDRDREGER